MIDALVRVAKATVGMIVSFVLGLHMMIQLLIYAIAFDVATGLVAAWVERTIDSSVSRRGIGRKVLILLGVAAAEIAGRQLGIEASTPWGASVGLGAAVAGYYCVHEALSIAENLARAGVPMPSFVLVRLRRLAETDRKDEQT